MDMAGGGWKQKSDVATKSGFGVEYKLAQLADRNRLNDAKEESRSK